MTKSAIFSKFDSSLSFLNDYFLVLTFEMSTPVRACRAGGSWPAKRMISAVPVLSPLISTISSVLASGADTSAAICKRIELCQKETWRNKKKYWPLAGLQAPGTWWLRRRTACRRPPSCACAPPRPFRRPRWRTLQLHPAFWSSRHPPAQRQPSAF